jgi:serine/threonine-protein kinase
MPIFSSDEWQRVEELWDQLIDADAETRAERLREIATEDADLADRLDRLLKASRDSGGLLDRPVWEVVPDLLSEPPTGDAAESGSTQLEEGESMVGPYRIVREIGRGGMGAVYLAVRADDQYRKEVAIKLVSADRHNSRRIRRFLRERQILATLEHPHIARLLDGGVTDRGVPYLVMEYVTGRRLDRYCDDERLTVPERLRLFEDVCRAVHYAHTKLVVHRDLKPGNVMVADDGSVKLLDFGIAKLLDPEPDSSGETMTRAGGRVLTPEYASPEHLQGEPVGTASDVYSLGVLMYELLAGRRPFEEADSLRDLERAVCSETPRRPSQTVEEDPESDLVARNRSTTLARLKRSLSGDVDNIVLSALRKEPERRYSSARSLVDDIERHLTGFPVRARPDTIRYRSRKFVRRHRVVLAAGGLALAALIAGLAGTAWQGRRAAVEAAKANEVSRFVLSLFEASDPGSSRGQDVTVRQVLDRGAERARTELADQPAVQAEMLGVLGDVYRKLSLYEAADELVEEALALRREMYGPDDLRVAESLTMLGSVRQARGDLGSAEELYAEAYRVRVNHLGGWDPQVADVLNNLGVVARAAGEFSRADSLHRRALTIREATLGPKHAAVAVSLKNLALVLHSMGRIQEAVPLYRRSLELQIDITGEMHPEVGTTLNSLASALLATGAYAEAEELYRRALAVQRQVLGNEHRSTASTLNNLARTVSANGGPEEAIGMVDEALQIRERLLGSNHPAVATSLSDRGKLLLELGRLDESRADLERALRVYQEGAGYEHPGSAVIMEQLARTNLEAGALDEADSLYTESLRIERLAWPDGNDQIAFPLVGLARIRLARGNPAEAEPLLRQALEQRADLPPEHWGVVEAKTWLAQTLIALQRFDEAEQLLLESITEHAAGSIGMSWLEERERARAIEVAAELYDVWDRPSDARAMRTRVN